MLDCYAYRTLHFCIENQNAEKCKKLVLFNEYLNHFDGILLLLVLEVDLSELGLEVFRPLPEELLQFCCWFLLFSFFLSFRWRKREGKPGKILC